MSEPSKVKLYDTSSAAEFLNQHASTPIVSAKTLPKWRCTGRYRELLPWRKLASKVYYEEADLLSFLESHLAAGRRRTNVSTK